MVVNICLDWVSFVHCGCYTTVIFNVRFQLKATCSVSAINAKIHQKYFMLESNFDSKLLFTLGNIADVNISIANVFFVKVFRYQPVHKTYPQPIITRLMSERLTMKKPRKPNSVLWGLLNCLFVLVGGIRYQY